MKVRPDGKTKKNTRRGQPARTMTPLGVIFLGGRNRKRKHWRQAEERNKGGTGISPIKATSPPQKGRPGKGGGQKKKSKTEQSESDNGTRLDGSKGTINKKGRIETRE